MKRFIATLLLSTMILISTGCTAFRDMTGGGATARDSAAKALNVTTKSAVAIMTLAGAAYDLGAWGEPGSPRAEDAWAKISAESVRLSQALTAWADAVEANKDAGPYQLIVATALAVIVALLPPRQSSALDELHMPPVTDASRPLWTFAFSQPDVFRSAVTVGGSR